MKHFRRILLYAIWCAFAGLPAYEASSQTTTQIAKLLASDAAASDYFGRSISISADGNTAIIGAYGNAAPLANQGSAYIYIRNTTTNAWTQQAKLVASDAAASDYFGRSVSISADGNTAMVGAYGDDETATNQGSAYIYTRNTTTNAWTQQAKLVASDAAENDYFGFSTSISADGNTAIVGAYRDDGTASDQGSAYIYTRNTTTNAWTQQAKLVASNRAMDDYFGYSVSISADGNTAIAGAYLDDGTLTNQGSAYIYTRNMTTNAWTQQAILIAADASSSDQLGISVSISADGNTAIAGAYLDDGTADNQGSAYIYTRNTTTNTWTQQAKLIASDAASSDQLGFSVAISADGNTAIAGAFGDDAPATSQGSAYIYTRNSATNTWTQQAKLLAADAAANDQFGISVSISADGNTAIAGAFQDDAPTTDQGSAYIFTPGCTIVSLPAPASGQTLAATQTLPVASSKSNFQSACAIASSVLPNGSSPVSGNTTSSVWVESSEPTTPSNSYTRRHWEITPATNPTTATGRVTLYVLQSEFDAFNQTAPNKLPTGPNDLDGIGRLRIFKYSGTSSNGTGLPATYSGAPLEMYVGQSGIVWNSTNNYWEISFNVAGFSGFFIGAADVIILPVKLTHFTAAKQAGTSVLNWKVAQEENIATYTIERSADGRSFTTVGSVASMGNTTAARSYSYTDGSPLKGANYYRLKIIEKDGKVSYSEIRLLNFGSQIRIALFPNPVKDKVVITGVEAGMVIRLLDAVGKVVLAKATNSTTETLAFGSLSKGFYSVQVYNATGQMLTTARVVKE